MGARTWIGSWPVYRQLTGEDHRGLGAAARSGRTGRLQPRTGLFSGFDAEYRSYDPDTWRYQGQDDIAPASGARELHPRQRRECRWPAAARRTAPAAPGTPSQQRPDPPRCPRTAPAG